MALALLTSCTAARGVSRPTMTIGETSAQPPPAVWQRVRLTRISTSHQPPEGIDSPPIDILGEAILKRIGRGDDRPVELSVEGLRVVTGALDHGEAVGIAAEFVLRNDAGEKRLSLEQSINVMGPAEGQRPKAYALLIDDLLDGLFYHPELLTFLGSDEEAAPADTALAAGATNLGPVYGTRATAESAEASGRLIWGDKEHGSAGAATLALGDTKLFAAFVSDRNSNVRSGFGYRTSVGVAIMPGSTVEGSTFETPTAFGLIYHFAGEIGRFGMTLDAEGYVDGPGSTFLFVPQATGLLLLASGNDTLITMNLVQVGAAGEIDIPLGLKLGLTGGVFAGAMTATINVGGSSFNSGFQFIWHPFGDLYYQTPTGRISLGLAFEALAGAAGSFGSNEDEEKKSIFKNPKLTFTWESRVGRGLAYKTEDLEVLGISVHEAEKEMATPRSAFFNASGAPVAIAAVEPVTRTFSQATAVSSDPAPRPIDAAPAVTAASTRPATAPQKQWMVLLPKVDQALGPNAPSLLRGVLENVLAAGGAAVMPHDMMDQTLELLDVTDVGQMELDAIADSMDTSNAVKMSVRLRGERVSYAVVVVTAGQSEERTLEGETTRLKLLSSLRQELPAFLFAPPPRPPEPAKPAVAVPTATPPTRRKLGVGSLNVTREYAARLGLPSTAGALVMRVREGSAGESAGITVKDVILFIDEYAVASARDVGRLVREAPTDRWVVIEVWRGRSRVSLHVFFGGGEPPEPAPLVEATPVEDPAPAPEVEATPVEDPAPAPKVEATPVED
ncbi:MAG: PDZ domain-containing protein, partial [Myxococcota bacterium]